MKIMNLKQVIRKLNRLEISVRQEYRGKNLQRLGNDLAKTIKERTRSGYGVKSNGAKMQPLKPLAKSTKRKKRSQGKSTKSRLTDSRRMLDNIKAFVKGSKIVLTFLTPRDKKVAREAERLDRPFFYLSDKEIGGANSGSGTTTIFGRLRSILRNITRRF